MQNINGYYVFCRITSICFVEFMFENSRFIGASMSLLQYAILIIGTNLHDITTSFRLLRIYYVMLILRRNEPWIRIESYLYNFFIDLSIGEKIRYFNIRVYILFTFINNAFSLTLIKFERKIFIAHKKSPIGIQQALLCTINYNFEN